jgi:hypothetical protein
VRLIGALINHYDRLVRLTDFCSRKQTAQVKQPGQYVYAVAQFKTL